MNYFLLILRQHIGRDPLPSSLGNFYNPQERILAQFLGPLWKTIRVVMEGVQIHMYFLFSFFFKMFRYIRWRNTNSITTHCWPPSINGSHGVFRNSWSGRVGVRIQFRLSILMFIHFCPNDSGKCLNECIA